MSNSGEKLSFPEYNYSSTANTIQKLLDGCDKVTTEEQVVEEIARLVKKPIDWFHLVSVFGNRDISDCGYGKTNYDLTFRNTKGAFYFSEQMTKLLLVF